MSRLVVFGATSAIAQAYVSLVAHRFSSVVLVARNGEYLDQVADHLRVICEVPVTSMVADFLEVGRHKDIVASACEDFTNCVLICYGELTDQKRCSNDADYAMKQFMLNGGSAMSLSAQVAPVLAKSGGGTLAAVGSVAGDRGRSSNYHYGAAKSALATFLSGLRAEMSSQGVNVITIKPGFVDTPMTREFKKGLLWASADRVALDIDRAIQKNKNIVYTPWFWRYVMLVIKYIPEFIFKRLSF